MRTKYEKHWRTLWLPSHPIPYDPIYSHQIQKKPPESDDFENVSTDSFTNKIERYIQLDLLGAAFAASLREIKHFPKGIVNDEGRVALKKRKMVNCAVKSIIFNISHKRIPYETYIDIMTFGALRFFFCFTTQSNSLSFWFSKYP